MLNQKAVSFTHLRYFDINNNISCRGGITLCYFTNDGVTYISHAFCAMADNFNYRTGRIKSLGRLNGALSGGVESGKFVESRATDTEEEAREFINEQVEFLTWVYDVYRPRDVKETE